MLRDEQNYDNLSRGYDFLFQEDQLEIDLALGQIQGILIEMYSILNDAKDKTSDKFKESKNRWLVLHKAYRTCERIQSKVIMMQRKLLISENELSNYEYINTQSFGDARNAKSTIRYDYSIDNGVSDYD